MRVLRFLAALAAATLAHVVAGRILAVFPQTVDLFLVVVVLNALSGDSRAGMWGGLAVGLVQDALTGGPFGLHSFADTVVGYGTARAARHLVIQRATGVLLVVTVAAVVQQSVLMILAFLFLLQPKLPELPAVVLKALTTGGAGFLAFVLSTRLRETRESWRRGRSSRLRL